MNSDIKCIYLNHENFILDELKLYGAFEITVSNSMFEALKEYGFKKIISNNKDTV